MQEQLEYVSEKVEIGITQSKLNSSLNITHLQQSSEQSVYEELVLGLVSQDVHKMSSDTDSLTLKSVQSADFCLATCELKPEIIP